MQLEAENGELTAKLEAAIKALQPAAAGAGGVRAAGAAGRSMGPPPPGDVHTSEPYDNFLVPPPKVGRRGRMACQSTAPPAWRFDRCCDQTWERGCPQIHRCMRHPELKLKILA